jgi:hypothetical protein
MQHFFFCSSEWLIDNDSQNFIKEYLYCKDSNTPPFPTLQETPAEFIDKWDMVQSEIESIRKSKENNGDK